MTDQKGESRLADKTHSSAHDICSFQGTNPSGSLHREKLLVICFVNLSLQEAQEILQETFRKAQRKCVQRPQ